MRACICAHHTSAASAGVLALANGNDGEATILGREPLAGPVVNRLAELRARHLEARIK